MIPVHSPTHVVVANVGPHPAESKKCAFMGIGITQLVIGVLAFLLSGIAISPSIGGIYGYAASGMWGGAWCIASGALALATGLRPHSCNVIGGLVVSILTCLAAFGAGCYEATLAGVFSLYTSHAATTPLAIHAFLAFLAFAEFIIAIIHSALCCSSGCCGGGTQGAVIVTQ